LDFSEFWLHFFLFKENMLWKFYWTYPASYSLFIFSYLDYSPCHVLRQHKSPLEYDQLELNLEDFYPIQLIFLQYSYFKRKSGFWDVHIWSIKIHIPTSNLNFELWELKKRFRNLSSSKQKVCSCFLSWMKIVDSNFIQTFWFIKDRERSSKLVFHACKIFKKLI